jgi:ferredoxin
VVDVDRRTVNSGRFRADTWMNIERPHRAPNTGGTAMKVWVDQDVCTGDGLCSELSPAVFQLDDSIAHVRDARGALLPGGTMVDVPDFEIDAVLDAAEDCPGECIFIEM